MAFRLFIYYCAMCGGCAALAGWALGHPLAPSGGVQESAVKGLFVGGAVGGDLSLLIKGARMPFFEDKDSYTLWSPTALGFIVLGLAIGFLIGLAQVLLREAWVRVEAGFRAGRELILSKPEVTIGRAESCDIGLFGDASVDRTHARIVLQGNGYVLASTGSGDTILNGARIAEPTLLPSGHAIQ